MTIPVSSLHISNRGKLICKHFPNRFPWIFDIYSRDDETYLDCDLFKASNVNWSWKIGKNPLLGFETKCLGELQLIHGECRDGATKSINIWIKLFAPKYLMIKFRLRIYSQAPIATKEKPFFLTKAEIREVRSSSSIAKSTKGIQLNWMA